MKPSQLPWVRVCDSVVAADGSYVAIDLAVADAVFIARAASMHDDLVATLQAVADYWAGGDVPLEIDAQMRATLARAKGE